MSEADRAYKKPGAKGGRRESLAGKSRGRKGGRRESLAGKSRGRRGGRRESLAGKKPGGGGAAAAKRAIDRRRRKRKDWEMTEKKESRDEKLIEELYEKLWWYTHEAYG